MAGASVEHREIDVWGLIELRERMNETGNRIAKRDNKHKTGSSDWLAQFDARWGL